MSLPEKIESLIARLPDRENAERFYNQLAEKFPNEAKKLDRNQGLLSDVLTLAAFSPLLATTILQNPSYISWLNRQRESSKVRGKDELVESLARFAHLNSSLDTNVLLARFRRRELLRIYLRDIRELGTIVEITEEISNLADAVLEYALRQAAQELDNRFGKPLETDQNGRTGNAEFCIVALGKLGSKELNYSSDIDLLFLYSADGKTSGRGARGSVTNREYFVKLAELVTKLVGAHQGEGAAYRVDLRLRPNGRVGALAISLNEAVNYYRTTARTWERQVLIRSRQAAGAAKVFQSFFERVKPRVFSTDETVENALSNVRQSKERINVEKTDDRNFNVKLGTGGIREIEFIAQALQLAYGGADEWLRAQHTLISLARLADRRLISETELTELFEAYAFLRRLEHRLQMENGLQTHLVPNDQTRRALVARQMKCADLKDFERGLQKHTKNVNRVFRRIFGAANTEPTNDDQKTEAAIERFNRPIISPLEKSDVVFESSDDRRATLKNLSKISAHYAQMIHANPTLIDALPEPDADLVERDYAEILRDAVADENTDFARSLSALRGEWSRLLLEIVGFDAFERIDISEAKRRQTRLAEASIEAAILVVRRELEKRFQIRLDDFPFAVLGLGKLGGGGVDYGSDLDLILIYDETAAADDERVNGRRGERVKEDEIEPRVVMSSFTPSPVHPFTRSEFYSRAVEIFVTVLSSLTRDGFLYRVDLRLRPDGKNGATANGKTAFLNYLDTRAAMWEWLAYVKLRAAAGDMDLATETERRAREIIHRNAQKLKSEPNGFDRLAEESKRIRERLEREKSGSRRARETDIKFGAGGMLDVYFAVRFLQLRDDVPDEAANRSTVFTLRKLYGNRSLDETDFRNFSEGYEFLNRLDHQLRLTVGRSSVIPAANQPALQIIAERMRLNSVQELLERLTVERLKIRESFEKIFGD